MPQLLVSVRDAAEAAAALAGGADLIDVKEPSRGAMGRADRAVIEAVLTVVAGRRPVSAALGELGAAMEPPVPGLAFAKIGLAGWRGRDWTAAWSRAVAAFPSGVLPVAVAYADWLRADAPSPGDVLRNAAKAEVLLIDTAVKDGTALTEHIGLVSLGRIAAAARSAGVRFAWAGSLTPEAIARLLPSRPNWIAVRAAACDGGRLGRVGTERVRYLKSILSEWESNA